MQVHGRNFVRVGGRYKGYRTVRQHHDLFRVVGHADCALRGQRLRIEQLKCGIVPAGHQHYPPVRRDSRRPRLRASPRPRQNLLGCRVDRHKDIRARRCGVRALTIRRKFHGKRSRAHRNSVRYSSGGGVQHPDVTARARSAPNLFSRRQRPQTGRACSGGNCRYSGKAGQVHDRHGSIARIGHVGIQVQAGTQKRGPVLALDLHDKPPPPAPPREIPAGNLSRRVIVYFVFCRESHHREFRLRLKSSSFNNVWVVLSALWLEFCRHSTRRLCTPHPTRAQRTSNPPFAHSAVVLLDSKGDIRARRRLRFERPN